MINIRLPIYMNKIFKALLLFYFWRFCKKCPFELAHFNTKHLSITYILFNKYSINIFSIQHYCKSYPYFKMQLNYYEDSVRIWDDTYKSLSFRYHNRWTLEDKQEQKYIHIHILFSRQISIGSSPHKGLTRPDHSFSGNYRIIVKLPLI